MTADMPDAVKVPWLVNEDVLANAADNLEAAGFYTSANRVREAWDRIEALQAEVAKRGRIASDLQALCDRQAIELGALRSEQSDLRYEIMEGRPDPGLAKGNFIEMVRMLHGAQKGGLARATAAEAERDALKAEVERALEDAAYKPGEMPIIPTNVKRALDRLRAALSPAKAGG